MRIGASNMTVSTAAYLSNYRTGTNADANSSSFSQSDTASTKVFISEAGRQSAQSYSDFDPSVIGPSPSKEALADLEANQSPEWEAQYYPHLNPALGAMGDVVSPAVREIGPEYTNRLQNIMSSVLKDNGIETSEQYHDALVVDKNSSEQIHQQFIARLKEDPQMIKWVNQLGISLV